MSISWVLRYWHSCSGKLSLELSAQFPWFIGPSFIPWPFHEILEWLISYNALSAFGYRLQHVTRSGQSWAPSPSPQWWFQYEVIDSRNAAGVHLPYLIEEKYLWFEESETNTQREALKADTEMESSNGELSTETVSFSTSFQPCLWIHLNL